MHGHAHRQLCADDLIRLRSVYRHLLQLGDRRNGERQRQPPGRRQPDSPKPFGQVPPSPIGQRVTFTLLTTLRNSKVTATGASGTVYTVNGSNLKQIQYPPVPAPPAVRSFPLPQLAEHPPVPLAATRISASRFFRLGLQAAFPAARSAGSICTCCCN